MTDRKPRTLLPLLTAGLIGLHGCSSADRDVEDARDETQRLGRAAETAFESATDADKRREAIEKIKKGRIGK